MLAIAAFERRLGLSCRTISAEVLAFHLHKRVALGSLPEGSLSIEVFSEGVARGADDAWN